MPLADWVNEASEPQAPPDESGEWRLSPLRWRLLQASLQATIPSPHLPETICGARERISGAGFQGPIPLGPDYDVAGFDCRVHRLNLRLRKAAEQVRTGAAPKHLGAETKVVVSDRKVAAYFTTRPVLATCETGDEAEAARLLFVPSLAVDVRHRGPHLAQSLVGHILAAALAPTAPDRAAAVIAFAITPRVASFFRRCGGRPMGELVHPRGMIVSAGDAAWALQRC